MSKLDDLFNGLTHNDDFFDEWENSNYQFYLWEPKEASDHGYGNHIQGVVRFNLNPRTNVSAEWFQYSNLGAN